MGSHLVALVIAVGIAVPTPAVPPATVAFDPAPAVASLHRLLPDRSAQIALVPVARPAGGDYFEISGRAGAVSVSATSPATLLTGVGWYLKYVAHVDISLPGQSISRLPATLPAPTSAIRLAAAVPNRFALNYTDDGYSGAYRDFGTYEHEIDLLALHGVNEVFVQVGTDAAYYATMQEFGYAKSELRSWIPAPEHQPWWLLQNMSSFGGPVSDQLLAARAAVGKKIVTRLRDLGMTPVLPGYFGTVPPNFVARNPTGRVVPQGTWCGFARPDWLDPRNVMFPKVAASFYRHQRELVGGSSMVKMDLLHEGGQAGDVPVGDAAKAVFTAMDKASPGATWVLLGWQNNPPVAIIDAIADKSRLFIVDGLSDRYDTLDRDKQWKGTPYAFGTIPNFGGHTTIGANTAVWASRFDQWRTKPNSALKGIAYLPEGTGTDPTTFELFTELAWHTGPLDQAAWFADYSTRRYGGADPHAAAAWEALRRGPYSMPSGTWSEAQDSLFAARPSLTAKNAAAFGPSEMRYDAATVQTALKNLLAVAPALRDTDSYRYDLVTTARQVLDNRSRVLLPQLKAAYDARDLPRFRSLATEWTNDLTLLDKVLGSDQRFLLGPWLENAKSWGMEYDARSIMTTWGPRAASENGSLHDYANRELSGLVGDFYAMRWTKYLAGLDTALVSGKPPVAIDWFAVEDGWNKEHRSYPTAPSGDPYQLAAQIAG